MSTVIDASKNPRLSDLIAASSKAGNESFVSIEFYPPKTKAGVPTLFTNLEKLKAYAPLFADVTWGAGGATSDLTMELCIKIKNEHGVTPNMHLTCTNVDAEKIKVALDTAKKEGITNILALRGDPPKGEDKWEASDLAFTCALDLVKHIRANYGDTFHLTVAGYPEGHPNKMTKVESLEGLTESELTRYSISYDKETGKPDGFLVCKDSDYELELNYLKQKVDAGANCIITQMFFDVELFINFVKAARAKGITVPILPGIMLIGNIRGFRRMTGMCKTRIPAGLDKSLTELEEKYSGEEKKEELAAAVKEFGIEFVTGLCKKLIASKVSPGLHFYTLNRSATTIEILKRLGIEPVVQPQVEAEDNELKGN